MPRSETISFINKPDVIKTVFILSILSLLFWFLVAFIIKDVYAIEIVGVIFEIIWLPMLLGLFFLPMISLFQSFKVKFHPKALPLYSLIMNFITIVIVFIRDNS